VACKLPQWGQDSRIEAPMDCKREVHRILAKPVPALPFLQVFAVAG
jgi:hypothetical protein